MKRGLARTARLGAVLLLVVALSALFAGPAAGAAGPAGPTGGGSVPSLPSRGLWPVPPPPGGTAAAFVPGEVIVTFAPGASAGDAAQAASQADSTPVENLTPPNASLLTSSRYLLKSRIRSTAELVATLAENANVVSVSPNYLRYATGLPPDDPLFPQQWGLSNTGQTGGIVGADVSVLEAWQVATGSAQVVVADVDSGVDYTHPDLVANVWKNPGEIPGNGLDDDGNGYVDDVYGINTVAGTTDPMDDNGHGTHTAGIAAAVCDDGVGVAGVGWNAEVMALKFLDSTGYGSDADAIACINYAVDMKLNHGVNVAAINASWGGSSYDANLQAAISAAGQAGIIFCAAAGNNGTNNDLSPFYPASFGSANVIAVAASDASDQRASFSDYGRTSVDLFAPGVGIVSTYPGNQYVSYNGTSMATPFVSGTVALLTAAFPGDTVAQRISRILSNVDRSSAFTNRCVSGGRLNAAAAVGYVPPPTYSVTATVTSGAATGTAAVSGSPVPSGGSATVTITPASNYQVQSVSDLYDGVSHDVTASIPASGGTYDITGITSNHAVSVSFAALPLVITVTSPNGGESWANGTSHNLTWSLSAPVSAGEFQVWLIDGAGNWVATVPGVAAVPGQSTYSAAWTVSAPARSDYRLDVLYRTNTGVWTFSASDLSNSAFAITGGAPVITVTSPNGGESWANGTSHNLTWSLSAPVSAGEFQVWLIDGAGNWVATVPGVAAVPGQSTYSAAWTVSAPARSDYRLDVLYRTNTGVWTFSASDLSNSAFAITGGAPVITVTSPNGGESWANGTSHNLTWSLSAPVSTGEFQVWLIDGAGNWVATVPGVAAVPGQSTYSAAWTVSAPARSDYRLDVLYRTNTGVWTFSASDLSNSAFAITGGAPVITVTSPNGGESWANGTSHNLTWSLSAPVSTGEFQVWLIDGAGNWVATVPGVAAVPGQSTYSAAWTVSAPARSDYRLDVLYRTNTGVWTFSASDLSNSNFTVTP